MSRVGLATAVAEFAKWKRFEIVDKDWSKWGLRAIILNSAGGGAAILVLGAVSHRTGVHLDLSITDLLLSAIAGAALGVIVGVLPAVLVRMAARAFTNRIGYINGQLALLYAGGGVLLSFPIISVFAVVVFPTVIAITFVGWLWFRTSDGGVDLAAVATDTSVEQQ
jgi:hypothetical protein